MGQGIDLGISLTRMVCDYKIQFLYIRSVPNGLVFQRKVECSVGTSTFHGL